MAKRRDYIPHKVSDFVDFQNRLCDEVTANAAAWGIDKAVIKALNEQRKVYLKAYVKAKDTFTRSQQDVLNHDEARAAYTQFLRTLVQVSLIRNTKIPTSVKVSAGWISDRAGRRKFQMITDRPVCYPESTSSAVCGSAATRRMAVAGPSCTRSVTLWRWSICCLMCHCCRMM